MLRNIAFLQVALALVALAGCAELDKLNTDGGNCDLSNKDVCLDYPDSATDGDAKLSQCTALQTKLGSSGQSYTAGTGNDCSTANRLGSCTVTTGTLRYYSGSNWNAASAEANCTGTGTTEQSGTWTAN
jgi:hypothetical protein